MSNKNYVKGRNKEYKIVHKLKDEGWTIAQRSAGSKSPIDIFAINAKLKLIKFIQAKPDDYPESAGKKIKESLSWLSGIWRVEFELI